MFDENRYNQIVNKMKMNEDLAFQHMDEWFELERERLRQLRKESKKKVVGVDVQKEQN